MRGFPNPGSVAARGRFHPLNGAVEPAGWQVAAEVPVAIMANSAPVAVMMATPCDLEELAMGYLLAEGLVPRPGVLRAALVLPTDGGFCVDVAVDPGALAPLPARATEGRSSCGLCGMEALTDIRRDLPHVDRPPLDPAAAARALAALADNQPMKAVNRSVHAAGFADPSGGISLAREDVGRHCALDKLAGALAQRRIDPGSGVAVLSSRCSFELVRKAALAGFAGLVTVSAPTAMALDMARDAGLPLACRAPGGVMIF